MIFVFQKTRSAKKSKKKADLLCEIKLDLETGKTLMVYFKIFQQNSSYIKGTRNPPRPKLIYGVILHGDCTLANLRDAIYCEFDFTYCKDRVDPYKLNKVCMNFITMYCCWFVYINSEESAWHL